MTCTATYPQISAARDVQPTSASEVKIPLRDSRNIGPNSVRFSAGQFSKDAPTVVLFGMKPNRWPVVKGAIKQAVFEGYKVNGVFMGSTDAPASLEIYADGQHVSRAINPNTISAPILTQLIKDVVRKFY